MSLLLDDLLDVSRITRGQLELKKDYVDLKSVVGVAVETARPLLDAKQHQLIVNLPPENIRLEADPLRLSQVLGNLLTNAAKYTDPDGRIDLSARLENAELVIAHGHRHRPQPEAMPGLFTMFSQVNSAIDRAEGGLGIGLALVKGLVALHGGRVEVRSEGLGRGSEFIVHLPHHVLAHAERRERAGEEAGGAMPAVQQRGHILVADDNRDAAESLALVLRFVGLRSVHRVQRRRGARSSARARSRRPRIIDIGMPGHEWPRSRTAHAPRGLGQQRAGSSRSPAGARSRTSRRRGQRASTSTSPSPSIPKMSNGCSRSGCSKRGVEAAAVRHTHAAQCLIRIRACHRDPRTRVHVHRRRFRGRRTRRAP